ncbi:WhiB family transcriptional regulator [Streptomyces sp. NPDC088925]|uniref:WhiB family transcriptional regulator n=1 Tax=Streptomyces sp. NPDC088925 TaxID=3365914 RepID=UPI0037FDF980
MNRPSSAWVTQALCAGLPGFVHPPGTLNTNERGRRHKAAKALAVCGWCPVRSECIAHVQPAYSKFDGVCGGRLWLNGREIGRTPGLDGETPAEPPPRAPCGTLTAHHQHQQHNEPIDAACAAADRARRVRH